jgi:hypothetical protein
MNTQKIDFSENSLAYLAGWVDDAIRCNKNTGLPLPACDLAAWEALKTKIMEGK